MTNQTTTEAGDPVEPAEPKTRKTPLRGPKLGVIGSLRWLWRQLTSMRTALFLLLLLAIAAVPGSIFPQRSIDAATTTAWLQNHTTVGPWLDRMDMFDVFSSPWFAAIYILLIVSLIGCIVPRVGVHLRVLRSGPPRVPRRLDRLPSHSVREFAADPATVNAAIEKELRRRRFKLRVDRGETEGGQVTYAAEGGRLRETGNLVFHIAVVVVVVAVAWDHLFGWRGDLILPVGQEFTSTAGNYDTMQPGPLVNVNSIKSWNLNLNSLDVTFENKVPQSSPQWGAARDFKAEVTTQQGGQAAKKQELTVNNPIRLGGANVYLLGNGYAPHVTIRNAKGQILLSQDVPFIAQDAMYRSTGAIKVAAASPKQLGFFGLFLPTAAYSNTEGPISTYPGLNNPELVLGLYIGSLYPGGLPQSVYTLDTQDMTQVMSGSSPWRIAISPGQTEKLPDNLGSITFDSVDRWAGLSARYDPGTREALVAALLGLAGIILSMSLRRRRVFLKVAPSDPDGKAGHTVVEAGSLAKGEDPRLQVALDALLDKFEERIASS